MEHLDKKTFKHLTPEQVDSFMQHGFLRVKNCFTKAQADAWTKDVWTRLGFDPNDSSTWTRERTNMPQHRRIKAKEIAPKAWDAICELAGGEDRVTEQTHSWSDSFIVNLGTPEGAGKEISPKELDNWHVDGDFFGNSYIVARSSEDAEHQAVHFLDSPEQGLLVIPCWTAVHPNGGATWICDHGPKRIGQWLYDHPEGVTPWMQSVHEVSSDFPSPPKEERLSHFCNVMRSCDDSTFHEMTGDLGDVILLHPLMLHSASKNGRRLARIITNPPVSLNQPFNFDRADPSDYSLVELKTIKELGQENLRSWKITGKRQGVTPERLKVQAQMLDDENARLEALGLAKSPQPESAAALEGHRRGVKAA